MALLLSSNSNPLEMCIYAPQTLNSTSFPLKCALMHPKLSTKLLSLSNVHFCTSKLQINPCSSQTCPWTLKALKWKHLQAKVVHKYTNRLQNAPNALKVLQTPPNALKWRLEPPQHLGQLHKTPNQPSTSSKLQMTSKASNALKFLKTQLACVGP